MHTFYPKINILHKTPSPRPPPRLEPPLPPSTTTTTTSLVYLLFTGLAQVEWASVSEEGVDTVIAYATTPDHDSDTYQSSKAVLSDLSTSAEVGTRLVFVSCS